MLKSFVTNQANSLDALDVVSVMSHNASIISILERDNHAHYHIFVEEEVMSSGIETNEAENR